MFRLSNRHRVCLEDGRPDLALDAINDVLHSCRETGGGAVGQLRWSTADLLQLERLCIVVLGRVGQWEQAVERLDVMRARYGDSFDERYVCSCCEELGTIIR